MKPESRYKIRSEHSKLTCVTAGEECSKETGEESPERLSGGSAFLPESPLGAKCSLSQWVTGISVSWVGIVQGHCKFRPN